MIIDYHSSSSPRLLDFPLRKPNRLPRPHGELGLWSSSPSKSSKPTYDTVHWRPSAKDISLLWADYGDNYQTLQGSTSTSTRSSERALTPKRSEVQWPSRRKGLSFQLQTRKEDVTQGN